MVLDVTLTGQNSTDQLEVSLNGTQVYLKSGSMTSHERPAFSFGNRAPGSYTMLVQLLDSAGDVSAASSNTIQIYPLGPVVIDQDNSLVINGTKAFLVTPWMDHISPNYVAWYQNGEMTNYGWNSDYSASYSPAQLSSMIDSVIDFSPNGVIAPGARMSGTITSYVTYPTVRDRTLLWYWTDEPDINLTPYGDSTCAAGSGCQQVVAMMTEAHNNDTSDKPVIVDFYGYAPNISITPRGYAYPNIVSDVFSFDVYPVIQSTKHASGGLCPGVSGDQGACVLSFAEWIATFDLMSSFYYDTVPFNPIVEMAGEATGTSAGCTPNGCPGPNANQFRMELWLDVIHGAKSLSMWTSEANPGEPTAAVNAELKTFLSILNGGAAAAILAPVTSRTVTSNQATPGSRVDVMVRETANNVWVFAQRLTDDLANPGEATFPALSTQLTISGLSGSTPAVVFSENRTVTVNNGVITDSFSPYATHIYQIPIVGNPPPPPPSTNASAFSPQVYPNPWRSDKHSGNPITFDQLSGNTTIKIFTVSAHLVKTLTTSNASVTWDLTNDSGGTIASGIYVYLITDSQGDKVKGKVAVIK
jgi:hypothetical protein